MSIPYEDIGLGRRAEPLDRDQASLALAGYVRGLIESRPELLDVITRASLASYANRVRLSQGLLPFPLKAKETA